MKPKDVVKWKKSDWEKRVKYMMPSSGGAVGVIFVWADSFSPAPATKPNPSTSQFVIKPIVGSSAAPTKFAEYILREVAGAATPHTKAIKHTKEHHLGNVVLNRMAHFRHNETNPEIRRRWDEVWNYYANAPCYLIQETQTAIKELGDYDQIKRLDAILNDRDLMVNLGKLFVADALIGNGDRLYQLNLSNVLFKEENKQICAIDSATILTNYAQLIAGVRGFDNEFKKYAWYSPTGQFLQMRSLKPEQWAQGVVKPDQRKYAPLAYPYNSNPQTLAHLPSSIGIDEVFSWEKWFENDFKLPLQSRFNEIYAPINAERMRQRKEPIGIPAASWITAKKNFEIGVELAKHEIDKKLSGLNWLKVKMQFKQYVSKYGGDPNLDWTNLKIRRLYFKLRLKKGLTAEQAFDQIKEYVERKFHVRPDNTLI